MPKTLLGKVLYQFIGCAACTTLLLCGLETYNYVYETLHSKEESDISERSVDDEVVSDDHS